MKTASPELFDLIHSLSGRERAYFKRFATMHKQSSDSNYLKVFDAICQQEEYDEKALKEQFKEEKFSRYFPRVKKYLYEKILEAMGLFHAEASASIRLKRQINNARFLYSKKLFKQVLKKTEQIKKEALEWEYWAEYLAALEIETSVLAKEAYVDVSYDLLQQITVDAVSALEKYSKGFTQYFYQKQMVYLLTHQTTTHLKDAENLLEKVESMDIKGITGQITQVYTMGLYAKYGTDDSLKAIECFDRALDLLEQNPMILFKGMDYYLFLIGRVLEFSISQSTFDNCQKYLQKITKYLLENESLMKRDVGFQFAVKVEYHYNRLSCLMNFGKYKQTLQALTDSNKDLGGKIADVHVGHALQHHYISLLVYFFHERFENAMQEANQGLLLEIDMHPLREKIQLWLLFVHWELQNYDLLEHLIRNTVRHWRKKDLYGDSKRFWIGTLQKLMSGIDEKSIWREAYEMLNPSQENLLDDVSKRRWQIYVRSKLEGKTIIETHLQLLTAPTSSNKTNLLAKESLSTTS